MMNKSRFWVKQWINWIWLYEESVHESTYIVREHCDGLMASFWSFVFGSDWCCIMKNSWLSYHKLSLVWNPCILATKRNVVFRSHYEARLKDDAHRGSLPELIWHFAKVKGLTLSNVDVFFSSIHRSIFLLHWTRLSVNSPKNEHKRKICFRCSKYFCEYK
jgi:hypothetical protein